MMKYIKKIALLILVSMLTSESFAEVTYIHTDYLGSVAAKTNSSGQIVARFHYAPFGAPDSGEDINNSNGYTGHVFDDELSLSYMQARYYDPVIGRFYSNDPMDAQAHLAKGNIHGFNRYTYANNNPYKYVDPDGEAPIVPVLIAGGRACASNAACRRAAVATSRAAVRGVQRAYSFLSGVFSESGEDVDEIEDFNPEEDVMEDDHKTKDGRPRIKIKKGDGSEIDITGDRVKRKDPAPNNPKGKGNDRIWKKPQPGTKGKKRDPLPKERDKIKELEKT